MRPFISLAKGKFYFMNVRFVGALTSSRCSCGHSPTISLRTMPKASLLDSVGTPHAPVDSRLSSHVFRRMRRVCRTVYRCSRSTDLCVVLIFDVFRCLECCRSAGCQTSIRDSIRFCLCTAPRYPSSVIVLSIIFPLFSNHPCFVSTHARTYITNRSIFVRCSRVPRTQQSAQNMLMGLGIKGGVDLHVR